MAIDHFSFSESFLHFVWGQRYAGVRHRCVFTGKTIEVLHPGILNRDQGPDFLNAQLRVDGNRLYGHVEIHVDARDWRRHGHHRDPFYNGVILHVVFQSHGQEALREDRTPIPEIVLEDRIPAHVFQNYHALMLSQERLPCAPQWKSVPRLVKSLWITRLAIDRIERRSNQLLTELQDPEMDWNQILWEQIAQYMGGPVNQLAFKALAQTIPLTLAVRYRHEPLLLESLLFGAAGFLATSGNRNDAYYQRLHANWEFMRHKHSLAATPTEPLRFHRMRPSSFPTIRLSQLANLIGHWPQPTALLGTFGIEALWDTEIVASPYWDTHYRFGKPSACKPKSLGKSQKASLVLNTLIPFRLLYERAHQPEANTDWAEQILATLPAENNRYTRVFENLGTPPTNALDSQGMITLFKHYCNPKHCLQCAVGAHILKKRLLPKTSSPQTRPSIPDNSSVS